MMGYERLWVALCITIASMALAGPARAQVPRRFTVQGVLRDSDGALQTTPVDVTVRFFSARTGGVALGAAYGPVGAEAQNGLFAVSMPAPGIVGDLAMATEVWLEIDVDGDTFPRQQVTSDVFALLAAHAESADSVSERCVGCITNAMLSDGIAGSRISGPVSSATSATNASQLGGVVASGYQRALTAACPTGQALSGIGADGSPQCISTIANANSCMTATDATNATTATTAVSFTGSLAGDVTGTQSATVVSRLRGRSISTTAPTTGQALVYDGSSWAPQIVGAAGAAHTPSSGRIFGVTTARALARATFSVPGPGVLIVEANFMVSVNNNGTFCEIRYQLDPSSTATPTAGSAGYGRAFWSGGYDTQPGAGGYESNMYTAARVVPVTAAGSVNVFLVGTGTCADSGWESFQFTGTWAPSGLSVTATTL